MMLYRKQSAPGLAFVALISLAVSSGCESATDPGPDVAEIGLPAEFTLNDNETVALPLTVRDRSGNPLNVQLTWESANPNVATVSNGVVTGRSPGYTTLTASARGIRRSNNVTVRQVPSEIDYISGGEQKAGPRGALPEPVVVRILDRHGEPVPGVPVDFRVIEGGGSASPAKTITDSRGYARATWRLGYSGAQTLEGAARVPAHFPALDTDEVRFTAVVDGATSPPSTGGPTTDPGTPELDPPAPVGDLEVAGTSQGSITLRWSSVNNGNGAPASYRIRVGPPGFNWDDVAESERTVPAASNIGQSVEYAYAGLFPGTEYEFQLVSVRDILQSWIYGARSNRVWGSTRGTVNPGDGNSPADGGSSGGENNGGSSGGGENDGGSSGGGNGGSGNGGSGNGGTSGGGNGGQTPAPSIGTLSISPESITLDEIGERENLSVVARSATGGRISNPNVTWTSLNPGIATVSSTGRVTARAVGIAYIVASATCCSPDTVEVRVRSNNPTTPPVTENPTPPASPTPPPPTGSASLVNECATPRAGWIFCDDFDSNRLSQYFEHDNAGGSFTRGTSVGVSGSGGMKAQFSAGQENAGSLKLAFGRTPSSYMRSAAGGSNNYRDVYWRVYVMNEAGWTGGGGHKMSRGVVFAGSNWSEAAIGHVWSGGPNHNYLTLDPASGTNTSGTVQTRQYNDFDRMRWLGARTGSTPIFNSSNVGQWRCVETRMRLNDAGQSNGVFEVWVDGRLETRATNLNWVGSYSAYGINALFLENFWNNGAPKSQARYFDNLVVSTQPIGCGNAPPPPTTPTNNPAPSSVASVSVSPSTFSLTVGGTRSLSATLRDSNGSALSGRSITWSSSDPSVASVSGTGTVTGRAAGDATITATSEGRSANARVSVTGGTSALPQTPGSTAGAYVMEDFSSYSSTSAFISDPRGIYNRVEDQGTARMTLDTGVLFNGHPTLRYDWPANATEPTITRLLKIPQGTKQVWVEAWVRYPADFLRGVSAKKILHVNINTENGRFGLAFENGPTGGLGVEGPSDNYDAWYGLGAQNRDLTDGQWHRIGFMVDVRGPKRLEFWLDGKLRRTASASTSATSLTGVHLGKNFNRTPTTPVSEWWGEVRVWTTDPGW